MNLYQADNKPGMCKSSLHTIKQCTVLLALLLAVTVAAQSDVKISGQVCDARTGKPLVGANVAVSGAAVGAVTDEHGRFILYNLLVGEYVLEASYIGYQAQQIRDVAVGHDQPRQILFRLQPKLIALADVVISAAAEKKDQLTAIVIDQETIRKTQAQDVAELLSRACGMEVQDNGSGKTLSIRGSQSSQVLVVVDGVRLQNGVSGAIDLATLPLSLIESIKVYKGAQSSLFGASALAGVVEIITRHARDNQASLELRKTSFAGHGLTATVMRKNACWDYMLSFEQNRSRNDYRYSYLNAGQWSTEARQNADVRQQQLYGRISREKAGQRFSLSGQYYSGLRGLPGAVYSWTPFARAGNERSLATLSFESKSAVAALTVQGSYHRDFSSGKNLYQNVPLRYRMVPPYWNQNELAAWQANAEYNRSILSSHKISAGVEGGLTRYTDQDRLYPHMAPVGRADTRSLGFYVREQFEKPIFAALTLQGHGGLRFDAATTEHTTSRRQDRMVSPSLGLGLRKHWILDWQVQAGWNRGFRLPTFADLFYQQYRVRGNANLRPERSENREWSVSGLCKSHWLRFTRFHNRVQDLIIWRMGSFAAFTPINTDALLAGSEWEWTWHPGRPQLQTSISYTRLRSENLSPERTVQHKQLPYRPEHSFKADLAWQWRCCTIGYGLRLSGERFITEANTLGLPGYALHEITMNVGFKLFGLTHQVKAACYNLTDENYQVLENAPLPGREWRVGWGVTF